MIGGAFKGYQFAPLIYKDRGRKHKGTVLWSGNGRIEKMTSQMFVCPAVEWRRQITLCVAVHDAPLEQAISVCFHYQFPNQQ